MTKYGKKLIEVALPLEAINIASAREKSIRHGHPSTLHLWWARRPLAAARAVIFAQMVDDPSTYVDDLRASPALRRKAEAVLKKRREVYEKARRTAELAEQQGISAPAPGAKPTLDDILAEQERERLFRLIEELVLWENTTNETVLQRARDEIWQSWRRACADNADHPRAAELFNRHKLPAFHDPFAGGGALPLEAQRLGLEAYASDLNPVAVLINKAMIEIPPKFAGRPPVHPVDQSNTQMAMGNRQWRGAQGLAEDVRFYGQWMRDEAEKRIGHLYPKVEITAAMVKQRPDLKKYLGQKLTVIAWLWARTVKSPNPAFAHVDVPLASTFMLSTKPGKEAYVEPVIEGDVYRFTVKVGKPKNAEAAKTGTKLARGANFRCIMSDQPIAGDYIKSEGRAGRLGAKLMAIVLEGDRGRVYVSPIADHELVAASAEPTWIPDTTLAPDLRALWTPPYGLTTYGHLFTPRQLVALTTFSDLVSEARERIRLDAVAAGIADDGVGVDAGGIGALAYAEAVGVYLAFAVSKAADRNTSMCVWENRMDRLRGTFGRQAIPMVWDFVETNPFAGAGGDIYGTAHSLSEVLDKLLCTVQGYATQEPAQTQSISTQRVVSTDPPYYDNIGYADLSDFFYVWLRRSLHEQFSDLFATVAVPKSEELVATPYRHGGKEAAERFFLGGMALAMTRLAQQSHPSFPVSIYYAFRQSETEDQRGTVSTGWETFLDAVMLSGLTVSGTWPIRSELATRNIGRGANALASSIILVCHKRLSTSVSTTRRDFVSALKSELPVALRNLQQGNIAPVDLAQSAIGPGMAIYTRYAQVLDAEGKPLSVREALALINQTLDEVLAEQEGDFDADSRWALAWFEQYGFVDGDFGVAETLSKAKNTSVGGLVQAGVLASSRGKVRLLRPEELPTGWDPAIDARLTAWEAVHHLIRALGEGGEGAAAELAAKLGAAAETARELAYRLYALCERKKRAPEALAYNGLVQSWPEIMRMAQEGGTALPAQATLFDSNEAE